MSALSGITVSSDLSAKFADAVQDNSTRFIKVSIQNESLVHDQSIPITGTFQEDLPLLQQEDVLQTDSPAYILAKLDLPSPDWMTFFYVPDTAKVRDKMLYASTRLSLLKALGSSVFTDSVFATSKADLTAEAYASHQRHVAAPHPLSSREKEMADLRAAENTAASYEGSRARASVIGTGVGLNWSDEVEGVVSDLGKGSDNAIVVFTIDPTSETLLLKSTGEITTDALGASLPQTEPCYALFAWNHTFTSTSTREIVFIYSCPSTSPIKHRMLYSSGSTTTYQAAKAILTASNPSITMASRRVETSDPAELNEAYLKAELGYSDVASNVPAATSNPAKGFAKPKGPPRRR